MEVETEQYRSFKASREMDMYGKQLTDIPIDGMWHQRLGESAAAHLQPSMILDLARSLGIPRSQRGSRSLLSPSSKEQSFEPSQDILEIIARYSCV